MIEGAGLTRDSTQSWIAKFYKNTNLRSIKSYFVMGDRANKPANAPTTATPKEFTLLLILTDAASKYPIKVTAHVS
jgi:hypothetical protein